MEITHASAWDRRSAVDTRSMEDTVSEQRQVLRLFVTVTVPVVKPLYLFWGKMRPVPGNVVAEVALTFFAFEPLGFFGV